MEGAVKVASPVVGLKILSSRFEVKWFELKFICCEAECKLPTSESLRPVALFLLLLHQGSEKIVSETITAYLLCRSLVRIPLTLLVIKTILHGY
jgi:hypothetical protein